MIDPTEPTIHALPERLLDLSLSGIPSADRPDALFFVTVLGVLAVAAMIAFLPRLRWPGSGRDLPRTPAAGRRSP